MNMIPKKRLAHRRGRTGFTLVEVIVVLVILAILAAIAIPALTGYIDRAQWRSLELRAKTQVTAIQTMLVERYAENGSFTSYAAFKGPEADDWFRYATYIATPAGVNVGINVAHFTNKGLAEYEKLTGDTQSNFIVTGTTSSEAWPKDGVHWTFTAMCDLSGAIKVYHAGVYNYFPTDAQRRNLSVIYVANAESNDPVTRSYMANNAPYGLILPSGFSIWRWGGGASPIWERIY